MRSAPRSLTGVYGIVDDGAVREPLAFADALLAGGIGVLQYRAKSGVVPSILGGLLARTRAVGALLIVNDDLEGAMLADGWHVGQEDLEGHDLTRLRAILGDRVWGISCGNAAQAHVAEVAGADYVGVGPFAHTGSKADAGAPLGAAGLQAVLGATSLPMVAIGGITLENIGEVARTGAAMAAVIAALARAPDPAAAARELSARWNAARG